MNTRDHTLYLTVCAIKYGAHRVILQDDRPTLTAENSSAHIRYSPVMRAFLPTNRDEAQRNPAVVPLTSVGLIYSIQPYRSLGKLKPYLEPSERDNVFFTIGLASLVIINASPERLADLSKVSGDGHYEYWPIVDDTLFEEKIYISGDYPEKLAPDALGSETRWLKLPKDPHLEIDVYVEQISASLWALWDTYRTYVPNELNTLVEIAKQVTLIVQAYQKAACSTQSGNDPLASLKSCNALMSALVELSAALSYAVTQGCSGCAPVLNNKSPFPHHSLLGIGGAIRAITVFVRYLERAFTSRSAGRAIAEFFPHTNAEVPANYADWDSGAQYRWTNQEGNRQPVTLLFDQGGDLPQKDNVPLLTHFSLRHGFMESKYTVTAASEALTAEMTPQWTLMTLSHEIMHNRVRTIFQALFGQPLKDSPLAPISDEHWIEFSKWISNRGKPETIPANQAFRNLILHFCWILHVYYDANGGTVTSGDNRPKPSHDNLNKAYLKHKQHATEALVHFHDYFFAYACQPKLYLMSVWASWIKVAAPYSRPIEYLVRSLATVAMGSGLKTREAFDDAVETLTDALDSLESNGTKSPLFAELRRLCSKPAAEHTRALFKPFYYLVDNARLFLQSDLIASSIDRIETDPFSEGSVVSDEYSASVYLVGDGSEMSPVKFSLASLYSSLLMKLPVDDPQWLSAWNYMVISSQGTNL